jgi:proline iminopeptidase
MRNTLFTTLAVIATTFLLAPVGLISHQQSAPKTLYPAIEPSETGRLEVSPLHSLYWEVSGNPDGIPAIVLHGGPGGRAGAVLRRLFDPQIYRIVLFDQRGAGRSTPFADVRENTTQDLVEDINRLRTALRITRPAVLLGVSWGTTLGLAYAQAHPERTAGLVLLGTFTCRASEIDHYYHGGVAPFYPEAFALLQSIVSNPSRHDYPRQIYDRLRTSSGQERQRIIETFVTYEEWLSQAGGSEASAREEAKEPEGESMAVLENYYLANRCFLPENALLNNAHRIAAVPVYLGNGRMDVIAPPRTAHELSRRLKNVRLDIVPGQGHVDLGVALAGVRGTAWIAQQLSR